MDTFLFLLGAGGEGDGGSRVPGPWGAACWGSQLCHVPLQPHPRHVGTRRDHTPFALCNTQQLCLGCTLLYSYLSKQCSSWFLKYLVIMRLVKIKMAIKEVLAMLKFRDQILGRLFPMVWVIWGKQLRRKTVKGCFIKSIELP